MSATTTDDMVYLTRKEAAALARVSTYTIDTWMREEDFPVLRLGERTRIIDRQKFIEWLAQYAARRGSPNPSEPSPTSRRRRSR